MPDGGFQIQPGQSVTVGRDPLNLIQIGHGSVEAFHCRFRSDEHGLFAEPLGGAPVQIAGRSLTGLSRVPTGATIQIGQVQFEAHSVEVKDEPGFRRLLWQDSIRLAKSVPWYFISIVFHVLLILLMERFIWAEDHPSRSVAIRSDLVRELEPLLEETVLPLETRPEDQPPELDLPELDLDLAEPPGDPALPEPLALFPESDLSPVGAGFSGRTGGGLMGGVRLRLPGGAGDNRLVPYLRSLRSTGMDVVFVVDTTSSMSPFLAQAKRTVDHMVSQLVALVEDLRIGVIAYRDESDEYLTLALPLTDDRYRILNFVESLVARGGGDIPEAVGAALREAVQMNWRPGTQRVVIVIGDAPPHEEDWQTLRADIGRFTRDRDASRSVVSTVFTGETSGFSSGRARETAQAFGEIARLGQGDFLKLTEPDSANDRLLLVTLGRAHEKDLTDLLRRLRSSSREVMIRKQFEARNTDWLLHKLTLVPVHPDVVNSLCALASPRVVAQVRDILLDEAQPLPVRRAARYILLKELGPFAFDPDLPKSGQKRAAELLKDLVRSY